MFGFIHMLLLTIFFYQKLFRDIIISRNNQGIIFKFRF